jgi:hypothetical protein
MLTFGKFAPVRTGGKLYFRDFSPPLRLSAQRRVAGRMTFDSPADRPKASPAVSQTP